MPIQVFYDEKCGLCSKEINYYKKIVPPEKFKWIDITQNKDPLARHHITFEDALKKLHVIDNTGKKHIGVDSFIIIWQEIRFFKILALIVSVPLIKKFVQIIYDQFAAWRFKKLKYCEFKSKT